MKKRYHPFSSISKKFGNFFSKAVAVLIFVLAFQPSGFIKAQSNTAHETENRLKKAAAKYFDDGDFIEAYPLYSQLLSLYPRDPNYNYRFGACLLFTKADKNKAVEYLQFSVRQTTVENLAYYYLGRALHLNYKFNAAIRTYKHFEEIASSADLKKYPVRHYIEMCTSGKELLTNLHGLDVLRKKELNLSDYFEAYDMHSNGGTLLSEPDGFKTKLDKEKNVNNVIYLTPDKKEAYFSSYGSNDKNGKDIYVVKKGADGTWGTPENLGNVINTTFDEDYPVYDVPRHTLYFCSKGHNSMGGYDIFMSVYDAVTQTWSQPQNMDFPVNTPDDDILFVPDTSGQTAFFSSTRSSPQGTIDVYKIALHLHRPETVVVAGTAYQDDGKTPTLCKITVKDIKSDSVVGVYMSSSDDGKYSFNLPNGGRYNYTVEASNHKTQSQPVVMPVSQTVSTMKQDIKFDQSGNLLVNNYPTEMPKDSDYQLAFNFIKDQAKMDVNVDTNSIKALLAQSANSASNVTATSNSSAVNSTNGLPNNTSGSSGSAASSVANNNSGGNNNTPGNNGVSNSGNTSGSLADNTRLAADEEVLNDKAAKALDYASDKMEDAQQLEAGAIAKLSNSGRTNSTVSNPDSVSAALAMLHQSRISEEKGEQAYQLAAEYKNDAAAKQLEIEKNTQ
ncbi:MAG TPA: hypothetical protein VK808_14150, partial [Bacteroidia bacterium]|nr:hypothetical protein [Bacteroidia bacterium]